MSHDDIKRDVVNVAGAAETPEAADAAGLLRRIASERDARRAAEDLLEASNRELRRAHQALDAASQQLRAARRDAETAAKANRRLTHFDPLTGLPNRRHLFEWLDKVRHAYSACAECVFGVAHVGLDRFKQINDTLGHETGDEVLQAAAQTLTEAAARAGADASIGFAPFVARIGGDEFVLGGFFDGPPDKAERCFSGLAEQLKEQLCELRVAGDRALRVGASIGLAMRRAPARLTSSSQILAEADLALYRCKAMGRGAVAFFTPELRTQAIAKRTLSIELPEALERGEFTPFYQPQVDARSHRIVGVEALARWRRDDGQVLTPEHFLPHVTELGLISHVDRAIYLRALADMRVWTRDGLAPAKLSINVSAERLCDPTLLGALADKSDLGEVSFELLETMLLDEVSSEMLAALDQIRGAGVGLEIDDFGSGHASIVGVMRVRPNRIKFDRALVTPIPDSAEHRRVLQGLVEMAHSIGVKVTAEGVETLEQAHALRELGCDTLQGFAFGRPMTCEAFTRRLRAERAWG